MNLRPGVDTHPPDHHLIVKVNLPFDERATLIAGLRELSEVCREKLDPKRAYGYPQPVTVGGSSVPQSAVADHGLNMLLGFGLRFFLGSLEVRGQEEVIPNFPPGGSFAPRKPTRFDLSDRTVPLYLRTMNATGDRDWLARKLVREGQLPPAAATIDAAYRDWLASAESDLIFLFEAENPFLVIDFWDAVRARVVLPFGLDVVRIHQAFNRGDGRDHTGFHDGIGNLQQRIESDPGWYRSKIYLPHPAPAYPGEPDWARDNPRYDGGTYLVHRKYVEHLDRWYSEDFSVTDHDGRSYHGEDARLHAIGRDRETGKVISRSTGRFLDREPDSTEVNLGYNESHVLKARGGTTAPFGGPFPPLKKGQTNVFNTQDIRIRRRGANFCEVDPKTGAVVYGLHFLCFQNNIQQTGFEFINNIWLLNPMFRRSVDGLFNTGAGVIEPVEGCYYFIPPEHREFPGDVFFQ